MEAIRTVICNITTVVFIQDLIILEHDLKQFVIDLLLKMIEQSAVSQILIW